MELTAYIRLLRRWLWLIVLAAVISGSISYIISRTQPPLYQATTTLQVGTYLNLANPNSGMLQMGEQLAQTYAQLAKTFPILQATVNKLQLPFAPESLGGLFTTRIASGTSLLSITVTYTDPVVVSDIANELAQQLIANSPTNLSKEQQQQLTILQDEISKAQVQLQSARDELSTIEASLDSASPDEKEILTTRRSELISQINTSQANLAQMSTTVTNLQQEGIINSLKVVEPSRIPDEPIGPATGTNSLLAALVSGVLAAGFGFLVEYLNDGIRSPAEIMPLMNVSPIGTIAPFGKKRTYNDKLIAWTQPRSTIAEAYRALRVNLMYTDNHSTQHYNSCRVYLVTSPGPSEGKSVTVANLSITFAITGMRVLLIDADLRRPSQHLLFNVPNTTGLSNLWNSNQQGRSEIPAKMLASDGSLEAGPHDEILRQKLALSLPYIIQKTAIPGLDIISSGPVPTNPAELLGTAQIQEMVSQLSSSGQYDAIFFDTPPVLIVSDTTVLANVVKAGVVVVVEAGRTRRAAAARAMGQLMSLSIQPLGVVVNRLNPRDADSGYGQYYYYGYYGYSQPGNPNGQNGSGQPGQNGQSANAGTVIQQK